MIKDLSFRYRSRQDAAIQDINLEVGGVRLVLVAGASGCGKTTLVRCVNGLIPRSYKGEMQGSILLQGQNIANLSLARISQLVGTVLQDPERQILGTKVFNKEEAVLGAALLAASVVEGRSLQDLQGLIQYNKNPGTMDLYN